MAECPHCNRRINPKDVRLEKHGSFFKKIIVVYSCPHCGKAISIGAW